MSRKSVSLLTKLPHVCVFDFETTGLNPYHDRIIEVASVRGSNIYQSLCSIDHEKLPKRIVEITGISDALLEKAPPERKVLSQFIHNSGERNQVCYFIGHNCDGFDKLFLQSRCQYYAMRIPTQWRFLDTLLVSKLLYPGRKRYNQASLCKDFNVVQENAHRADDDVKCLSKLFDYFLEDYASTRNLRLKTQTDCMSCIEAMWKEVNFKDTYAF
jgi:DNA polymerase III alpha subunit (gram-positive type)